VVVCKDCAACAYRPLVAVVACHAPCVPASMSSHACHVHMHSSLQLWLAGFAAAKLHDSQSTVQHGLRELAGLCCKLYTFTNRDVSKAWCVLCQ
jgi:hypothetical protein